VDEQYLTFEEQNFIIFLRIGCKSHRLKSFQGAEYGILPQIVLSEGSKDSSEQEKLLFSRSTSEIPTDSKYEWTSSARTINKYFSERKHLHLEYHEI